MRITENMRSGQVLRGLADLKSRHAQAALEATTGSRVNSPSDDPFLASRAVRSEASLARDASLKDALNIGRADLQLAESSLDQVGSLLQRAKELAMTAANGATTPEGRQATAVELQGIRDSILQLANTKGERGSIFAGSATDQPAFSAAGAFQGNTYEAKLRTGSTSEVVVNASGSLAFTAAGGRDIFQDLSDLATAMQTNDVAGITSRLDALDQGHEQVVQERSRVGVRLGRIQQSEAIIDDMTFLTEKQRAETMGVDPTESLSKLITLQTAIEQSIAVAQKMLNLDSFRSS